MVRRRHELRPAEHDALTWVDVVAAGSLPLINPGLLGLLTAAIIAPAIRTV
jgi:hypothetical protein